MIEVTITRDVGLQQVVGSASVAVIGVLVQPELSAQVVSAAPLMTITVEITRDE